VTGPELRTERLLLRRWRPEDRDPFAALNADPEVMRHFVRPLSRAESDAAVDQIEAGFARHGYGWWAVEVPEVAPFIGFVGLSPVPFDAPFTPAVEIGWRLARAHWRQGYAREAATECLRFAFDDLELDEVVSFTAVGNEPSRAVMASIGMTRDESADFDHPRVEPGSPIRRHVLYRIAAPVAVTDPAAPGPAQPA
jgi:ribosomal-protein-alanine N-acetyltransferase